MSWRRPPERRMQKLNGENSVESAEFLARKAEEALVERILGWEQFLENRAAGTAGSRQRKGK